MPTSLDTQEKHMITNAFFRKHTSWINFRQLDYIVIKHTCTLSAINVESDNHIDFRSNLRAMILKLRLYSTQLHERMYTRIASVSSSKVKHSLETTCTDRVSSSISIGIVVSELITKNTDIKIDQLIVELTKKSLYIYIYHQHHETNTTTQRRRHDRANWSKLTFKRNKM